MILAERPQVSLALDWLHGDVAELRDAYERAYRVEDRGEHRWESIDAEGGPLGLLIQHPRRLLTSSTAIVYFHGGGWIVGSPSTHADISRALCEESGLTVFSVDYRLAPEFVAPAPVEDGLAVLRWVLSGNANSVILCGDSAGGAIALAVERTAGAALRQRIAGVCSLYGAFGLLNSRSLAKGSRADGMDRECVDRMWTLANPADGPSPYSIARLWARSPVPAYLLAASEDPVLDDTTALAEAFASIGRKHVLDRADGVAHGFLHDAHGAERNAAVGRVGAWMRSRAT